MARATTVPEVVRHLPRRPFYFNTSAHLLRITRERAETLNELLRALRSCPEDSIFQHTFRTLQEHHFIREGFSNDFAHWALEACNEPGLAERLASVDVREFTSISDLRNRIVSIVEEYLQRCLRCENRRPACARHFLFLCLRHCGRTYNIRSQHPA